MIIPVGFQFTVPIAELECDYVRSSGPGGQNVNKVNSKCIMRWSIATTPSLPEPVRARFMERFATRLTQEGELVITSDRFRDQRRNFEDCLEKVQVMLDAVARPPKPRVKTKPSRGSKRRRLTDKRAHGEKKAARLKPRE